ncbi:MAG: site-specific tyrosine recombinase XerD [Planctomycetaceae bacterium]|nr:site-specific tyrosine recombinase XerD [Planctomycetaceae bacterium]
MPPRRRPQSVQTANAQPFLHPRRFLDPFLAYLEAECGMSANTVAAYRNDLLQFVAWCEEQRIVSVVAVNLEILTSFLQHLHDRGLQPSTIARRIVALKMFFRFLVLEEIIAESAMEMLTSPKLWQYLPTVLSPEMVDQLLEAPSWEDPFPLRDRAVLAVLYSTGCRASELSGMRLQDINLTQRFCRCLGKGNKERIVSLTPVAVAAIQNYLEKERVRMVRSREQDYLFVTRTGRSLTRVNIWQIVKRYARRIGAANKVSPHTLRHSFATHMLAGGAEIRALQEMLGHASIRTTQIYTQVEHSRLKAIHSKCHPRG